jgi:hypothetical protein
MQHRRLIIVARQAEDMEYVYLLEQAVATKDPIERIALIATFAISGYACTRYRPGRKPLSVDYCHKEN